MRFARPVLYRAVSIPCQEISCRSGPSFAVPVDSVPCRATIVRWRNCQRDRTRLAGLTVHAKEQPTGARIINAEHVGLIVHQILNGQDFRDEVIEYSESLCFMAENLVLTGQMADR